jgi:flagellar hook-basal body protein
MSLYTSMTGLDAATTQLDVTSNNIANAQTTAFKASVANFGNIFASSALQNAATTVGQGVTLTSVTQDNSQGNIVQSDNSLDMAISGSGYFPMVSSDGLQQVYTRDGEFQLNSQFQVVNAAGQKLMASAVDSTGNANVNNRSVLTIPQTTVGEASATSELNLGINFPSSASVITKTFNPNDSSTYNYSNAMTVYDGSGNSYLATVYYAKTQNASSTDPTNKWQTYVEVGGSLVQPGLQQATNSSGEQLYVNKYGQLATYSSVKNQLVNGTTEMFNLDQLTDTQTSVAASVTGSTQGIDFDSIDQSNSNVVAQANAVVAAIQAKNDPSATNTALTDGDTSNSQLFSVQIDGQSLNDAVSIDMSWPSGPWQPVTTAGAPTSGFAYWVTQQSPTALSVTPQLLAQYVTDQLQAKSAGEKSFTFTGATDPNAQLNFTLQSPVAGSNSISVPVNLDSAMSKGSSTLTPQDAATYIQNALNTASDIGTGTAASPDPILAPGQTTATQYSVAYSQETQQFVVTPNDGGLPDGATSVSISGVAGNSYGLTTTPVSLDSSTYQLLPTVNSMPANQQRFGMQMTYDAATSSYTLTSGSTGDTSSVVIPQVDSSGNSLISSAASLFGIPAAGLSVLPQTQNAVRGLPSTPAVVTGDPVSITDTASFSVDTTNNTFDVTVGDVKGVVTVPPGTYSAATFATALQNGINNMGDDMGGSVNGVKVSFNNTTNEFSVTSGETGSNAFLEVSSTNSQWGFSAAPSANGTTSTWIQPTQYVDSSSGTPQPQYITASGQETSSSAGFTTLPEWSPIYLTKGELTFNTNGQLSSPLSAMPLSTVFLQNGAGSLSIKVNYTGSTQANTTFAVASQSQDGKPEGQLQGLTIGSDGLVTAAYSNGTEQNIAKISLATFTNPSGLQQLGNSEYLATASSGSPALGTAGSAGYGTIQSGATESSNVDLTTELVNLITEQRNFQANAKAIQTSGTMTDAIINMQG